MLDIEFDDRAITKELGLLAKAIGVNVRLVYFDQMRLWLNDLIKRTPPKSNSQGKKAVKNDISKLFLGVRDKNVLEYFDDEFQQRGKLTSETIINRSGDFSAMSKWHSSKRMTGGSWGGRVRQRQKTTVDYGNGLSFINKMYVPVQSLNKYIKKKQESVGKLKAGWVKNCNKVCTVVWR